MTYKHEAKRLKSPGDLLTKPWKVFKSTIHKLDERQLVVLLKLEMMGKRRRSYALCILTRKCALQTEREKKELEKLLTKKGE